MEYKDLEEIRSKINIQREILKDWTLRGEKRDIELEKKFKLMDELETCYHLYFYAEFKNIMKIIMLGFYGQQDNPCRIIEANLISLFARENSRGHISKFDVNVLMDGTKIKAEISIILTFGMKEMTTTYAQDYYN